SRKPGAGADIDRPTGRQKRGAEHRLEDVIDQRLGSEGTGQVGSAAGTIEKRQVPREESGGGSVQGHPELSRAVEEPGEEELKRRLAPLGRHGPRTWRPAPAGRRAAWAERRPPAAGVTPGIRAASPIVLGRRREHFSTTSAESPDTAP